MKTNVNKHPNGYWNKIQYWNSKLNKAITNGDLRGVDSAHKKMNYFIDKQWELEYTQVTGYDDYIIAGVDFSESLTLLRNL